jgi:cytochrome oxidase Cu insertion factor (SCO1/SenC/PrrC family)
MLLASLLLVAAQATPPSAPDRPDPMTLGPAVGQPLPTFEAPDSTGVPRRFESLKGPNGLVLVFFRSADW